MRKKGTTCQLCDCVIGLQALYVNSETLSNRSTRHIVTNERCFSFSMSCLRHHWNGRLNVGNGVSSVDDGYAVLD